MKIGIRNTLIHIKRQLKFLGDITKKYGLEALILTRRIGRRTSRRNQGATCKMSFC